MSKWLKVAGKTLTGEKLSEGEKKLLRGARGELFGNEPAPASKTLVDWLLEQESVATPDPAAVAAQAEAQRQVAAQAEEARIRSEAEARRVAEERAREEARTLELAQAQSEKQAAADKAATLQAQREAAQAQLHALEEAAELDRINIRIAELKSKEQAEKAKTPPAYEAVAVAEEGRASAQPVQQDAAKGKDEVARDNKLDNSLGATINGLISGAVKAEELRLTQGEIDHVTSGLYYQAAMADRNLPDRLQVALAIINSNKLSGPVFHSPEEAAIVAAAASSTSSQSTTEDVSDAEKWANQILAKQENMYWLQNVTDAHMQEDIAGHFARKLMANTLTAEELRDALKASNVVWMKGPLDTYCFNHYSINGEGREVVPELATKLHTIDDDGPWPVTPSSEGNAGFVPHADASAAAAGESTHPYDTSTGDTH